MKYLFPYKIKPSCPLCLLTFFCILAPGIFLPGNSAKAAPISYTFTAVAGAYTANATPNLVFGGGTDNAMSGPIPIGFTFYFGCTAYTDFLVTENGWITFDPNCWDFHATNNLSTTCCSAPGVDRPIIAPLWDDLATDNFGNVNYKLTGGAGSRIMTIEWKLMIWYWSGVAGTISFQTKLYEGTNRIEFVYKQEAGALAGTRTASIGLGGVAVGDYYTLNGTGAAPTASKGTNTTNLSTRPANGQIYRWDPVCALLPIELSSFTGKNTGKTNLLEWITASESNNDFFTLEKSLDGITFSELSQLKGSGNSDHDIPYSTSDERPAKITYYRLKQTDFDGEETLHKIIAVYADQEGEQPVFPNPADDFIFIDTERGGSYRIYNSAGILVRSGTIDKDQHVLDVSMLDEGMYFMMVNGVCYQKMMIRH